MPSRPSHPEFAPERALSSLPWLAALGLLALNDHVLKGAGLLPGVVTGKLSDFAGMIVAPALLAALVRARTRTSLLACHAAIALVFAGIQLSPAFAGLWSSLMGLVGYPWVITSDPTDLLALPTLVVAWRLLVPRMTAPREHEGLQLDLHRLAHAGAGLVGLWACVATSKVDAGVDTENTWYEDVYGSFVVNNANEYDITVFVRELRPEVQLDCDVIEADPGRLLPSGAFADAVTWTLPPRTNMPVLGSEGDCSAAWIGGEGVPPTILFWRSDELIDDWYPGQFFAGESLPSNAAALVFDELGGRWVGGETFRFTPDASVPEQDPSCEFPSDEHVDWDTQLAQLAGGISHVFELTALEHGVDGCDELGMLDLSTQDSSTAYLCMGGAGLPFAVGDNIRIYPIDGGIRLVQMDEAGMDILLAVDGAPLLEVRLLRAAVPAALDNALGPHEVVAIPRPSCEWQVDAACAAVERIFELAITGVDTLLAAGSEPLLLVDPAVPQRQRELSLVSARERALADSTCVTGSPEPGLNLDAVVINRYVP
jgi:hypothetical protein